MIKLTTLLVLLCLALASLHAAMTTPQLLEGKQPAYPESLKKLGTMGEAKILTKIDATGAVTEASVKSATHGDFGAAALEAVKAWRFKPAEEDGKPVATTVTIPLQFKLTMKEQINAEMGREVFVNTEKLPEKILTWAEVKKWFDMRGKNANRVPYPAELKGSGISEAIEVRCIITPEGQVLNPTIVGIKNQQLVLPVIRHIAQARFQKPVLDGKPVYVQQKVRLLCSEDPNFAPKPDNK